MDFDSSTFTSGLGGLLGGLFNKNPGKPYDAAMNQYQQYGTLAQGAQQPYYQAGQNAIGNYQNWLNMQHNPVEYLKQIMGQYQESPYNQFLQRQAQNAGNNAASAEGTLGSTPFLQQSQQNAANIGQQGMNDWLQKILGLNTQYGQGQQNLINGGQTSANSLSELYNQLGNHMAEQSYNKETSKKNNLWNTLGGGLSILGSFL